MAAAKIRTAKGGRAEIFSRSVRKNTARLLTAWIVGTGKKALIACGGEMCYAWGGKRTGKFPIARDE